MPTGGGEVFGDGLADPSACTGDDGDTAIRGGFGSCDDENSCDAVR